MLGVAGEETMMRRAITSLIVIALGLTMSGVAVAGDPTVETVASFDAAKGELPEGLAITDRGVTYVGFAPTGQIVKVADDGSISPVATLPRGQGFLVGLALDGREDEALERLRRTIRSAAPDAEECISYQLPAFRLNGILVAFGARAHHCAFYPMSGTTVAAFQDELKAFETSKGTVRFDPRKPLPAALVRRMVKARIAENED